MSKPPKKWSKWIPHTGDECPVGLGETVKAKTAKGNMVHDARRFLWTREDGIKFYKRLRANVEGEKAKAKVDWPRAHKRLGNLADAIARDKASEFEDVCAQGREAEQFESGPYVVGPEKPLSTEAVGALCWEQPKAEPTPIITGPGEYVTEGGEKAIITDFTSHRHSAKGTIEGKAHSWRLNGVSSSQHYPCDIIGPWEEPEAEPEMWVNVYPPEDGGPGRPVVYSVYPSKAKATSVTSDDAIGTFKLTKGEG